MWVVDGTSVGCPSSWDVAGRARNRPHTPFRALSFPGRGSHSQLWSAYHLACMRRRAAVARSRRDRVYAPGIGVVKRASDTRRDPGCGSRWQGSFGANRCSTLGHGGQQGDRIGGGYVPASAHLRHRAARRVRHGHGGTDGGVVRRRPGSERSRGGRYRRSRLHRLVVPAQPSGRRPTRHGTAEAVPLADGNRSDRSASTRGQRRPGAFDRRLQPRGRDRPSGEHRA